ncbi:ferritin [Candidatus Micrarchaeota archaeon]|nr:ferritin [Candidatus Micrarchaeota archaeon]MBU2476976.1 ferritin [Candidatus Micrarchaeota archaeon]
MGTIGQKIVGLDVEELIKSLNEALADEWLAYYQYWIGAKVIKGVMKDAVITELNQHAADELRHAGMLADRIIQLGGIPLLDPKEWTEKSGCGYNAPKDFNVLKILAQNIKGEQCAIQSYQKLVEKTKDKDIVTYNIIVQILTDEVEHEEDLQALEEDLKTK